MLRPGRPSSPWRRALHGLAKACFSINLVAIAALAHLCLWIHLPRTRTRHGCVVDRQSNWPISGLNTPESYSDGYLVASRGRSRKLSLGIISAIFPSLFPSHT